MMNHTETDSCPPRNALARARSPYLRQHAGNPVAWREWDEAALQCARDEHKPIFLSIGYSACHWCHVMAHESFEDPATAAVLNEQFISIKVDREERPDLDSVYMAAAVTMTGSGGWPLSVFLTPDGVPFYAGTYFPPEARHGLPGFRELLRNIARVWREERGTVDNVAARVRGELQRQQQPDEAGGEVTPALLDAAASQLCAQHDARDGGWGAAPKFPHAMALEFLLRRHLAGHPSALNTAAHTLRAMARGGMYDVVGGGFARYATDAAWRVPHFEKMLYDNALLARAYLHAWQCTGEQLFRRVAEETLGFAMRELAHPGGGFFSSLDADSGGVEGAFYVWTAQELEDALGAEWPLFRRAYGVTADGNWEGKTVLHRVVDDAALAAECAISNDEAGARIARCHQRLLAVRGARVRPGLDDKILTAWNGLMLSALAEAGRVWGAPYLCAAQRTAAFVLTALRPRGALCRAWREGSTSPQVFLDDYAALIVGLLDLYQTDYDLRWYRAACELAEEMTARFSDSSGGLFDTPADAPALIVRPKELQDNATPSGNALAAEALLTIAALSGNAAHRTHAERMLQMVAGLAQRYPLGFARWLCGMDFAAAPVEQVALAGAREHPGMRAMLDVVRAQWAPHRVTALADDAAPPDAPTILAGRGMRDGQPTAYVCTAFTCSAPITTADELARRLRGARA